MSDVFIAHVEEDAAVALEIALGLEEAGYTTWCYEVDSVPGPSYLIQTGQAVEQAKVLVLVISPHSVGSRQVTREVVRAHETGKEFVPVLRDITHIEFQNRQPEWREAVGAAASIRIPAEGTASILPRIFDGLKTLGIHPRSKSESARIVRIQKALGELSVPIGKSEFKPVAVEMPSAKAAEEGKGKRKWIRLVWIALSLAAAIALSIVVVILINRDATRLLYEDDFSNPGTGWLRHSDDQSEMDYEDGEYRVLGKEPGAHMVWCQEAGQFGDFALEIDARLVSGTEQARYGLVFRLQDLDNFYSFLVSPSGYYLVQAWLNGVWTTMQAKTESAFIEQGNSKNHLEVICKGSQIALAVNGHSLATITDNSLTSGDVGMIVRTPAPNADVHFDNIRVFSIPKPQSKFIPF